MHRAQPALSRRVSCPGRCLTSQSQDMVTRAGNAATTRLCVSSVSPLKTGHRRRQREIPIRTALTVAAGSAWPAQAGLDQPGRRLGRDAQVARPVPGAASCPGGPGPSRPARAAAVATRSHARKQHRQSDTRIMKICSRDTSAAGAPGLHGLGAAVRAQTDKAPVRLHGPGDEGRKRHGRMRGRENLGGRCRAARPEPPCAARCACRTMTA